MRRKAVKMEIRLFRCFDALSCHLTEAKTKSAEFTKNGIRNCFEECNVFWQRKVWNSAPFNVDQDYWRQANRNTQKSTKAHAFFYPNFKRPPVLPVRLMTSSRFDEYFTKALRAVNTLWFLQIGDLQGSCRELQRQLRLAEKDRDRVSDAVRQRDQQVTCFDSLESIDESLRDTCLFKYKLEKEESCLKTIYLFFGKLP